MKFLVTAHVTVSCYTEVEADSPEEAINIAEGRGLAEVIIDSPYSIGECWHMDNDGVPFELSADAD
jgi:hypothetical protein